MIDLVAHPYGLATFRNGKQHKLHFMINYHDKADVSYRVEHGLWCDYTKDGKNLERGSKWFHYGDQWDIVEWVPLENPPMPAELSMHCCGGFGL